MDNPRNNDQGELWEVFIQESDNAPHVHAGSIRAEGAEMAIQYARDVFARRGKMTNLWVVKSENICSTSPADTESFFDPAKEKVYRHPQFYKQTLDDELWNKK